MHLTLRHLRHLTALLIAATPCHLIADDVVDDKERSGATETGSSTPELGFIDLFNGKDLTNWVDVNTSAETWRVKDGLLVCSGHPIGVMRSAKQYENFILVVEWRHMEAGGNSGVFLWSDAKPDANNRLPLGMEVQMLELDWPYINAKEDGTPQHLGYVSGELFGAGGMNAVPENPRGTRSMSYEMRCKGKGEWNRYVIVAVDGTVKLSINGKFVNGIREADLRKGYLCMESEGAEIHFRKIQIMELPSGRAEELGMALDSEKPVPAEATSKPTSKPEASTESQ
ncbi:MAG: DUF1080 domain-containing protein [Verrucomicrobia bacterium]|nr:DUF1080 domain-containing protein [Verrucomicrobiota bacterium]